MTTPAPLDSALVCIARTAATHVGDYLRKVARSVDSVETKRDFHDPVTVHDKSVERALHLILGSALPFSRVLGEETGAHVLQPNDLPELPEGIVMPEGEEWERALRAVADLGERVRWIIDPIDGTANFAAGLPWFNTSIGVELDERMVAGVVNAPLLGELFSADSRRAWVETSQGVRELDARGADEESKAVIITYYPGVHALASDPKRAVERERRIASAFQSTRRYGAAALDLAYVAAGWIGAMMGTSFKPWDVAAGLHILSVSGGNVMNLEMGTGLGEGLRPGVVASNRGFLAPSARAVLLEIAQEDTV